MQITDVTLGLAAGVGIDLSPDGKTAYYVEWSIGELSKVDVHTGMVTTAATGLTLPEDVEVDWNTGDVFVSQRSGEIIKASGEKSGPVAKPGGAPHQLALVKKGTKRFLYTVCYDSGRLVRIDLGSKAIKTIATGLGHPVGLEIDAAQKFAYVTEQDSGALTRVDLATGTHTLLLTGLIAPFYLDWDKDASGLFCVQRDPANSLVRIDLGPPVSISTIAAGLAWRPSGVAPTTDNKLIYICADRKLQVISLNGGPTFKPPKPPFEIYSVQFKFDGSPAFALKDHVTGNPVPLPEYVKGVRNGPAAYTMATLPHIKVVLRKLPGFTPGAYAIGATGSLGGVRRQQVTPAFQPSGLTAPIDFQLMWPLPGAVDKPDVTLDWYARKMPGPSIPVPTGSATHRLYLLVGQPTAPWVGQALWVAGLELACGWAAGAADHDAAAALVTEHYNGSGVVSYDTVGGSTFYGFSSYQFSQMIERLNGGPGLGGKVNCTDSANTVSTIANLIGCDLWQSRMEASFALNEVMAIGFNTWAVPFGWGFSYHEVAWKDACTQNDNVFDGCLKVDGDADPTAPPHTPLLPTNMLFGDCTTMNYRLRLCPPTAAGCARCQPQPGTRQRRPIS
jgi:hypothetical protein